MNSKITNSINLQISGEIGKYNTLPIDYLVEISKTLQNLLQTIAKVNISETSTIDLNNFKIELSGFSAGSAIPQFEFTNRIQTTINDVSEQRKVVKEKFTELLRIADGGEYINIKKLYPDGFRRNAIVEGFYAFTSSFGNSPVNIVDISREKNGQTKVVPLYKVKKFNRDSKDKLMVKLIENKEPEIYEDVSLKRIRTTIKDGKKVGTKILEEYSDKKASLSYSPDVIVYGESIYELVCPLRCLLEKEEDYFIINCELLDIVGTGQTIDEAEQSLSQEFDYIYRRYNELDNEKLTKRLQAIKTILNLLVKS